MYYEIRVQGHLRSDWSDWFGGLTVHNLEDGQGTLSGVLPDQAALIGVLNRIHALNLTLLSLSSAVAALNNPNAHTPGRESTAGRDRRRRRQGQENRLSV